MTDKVHKIRKEVARIQLYTQSEVLKQVLDYIDEVQKEPVSEDKMTISKEWFEHCKKSWYNEGYIDGEYNRDRQFEESVSEDLEKIVEEIAEPTILNAYGTKELARRLRNTICGTSVIEGLEEAAKNHAVERFRTTRNEFLAEKCKWSFKAGAKWQKTKDESSTQDLGEYINELSKQFPEVSFAKLSRIAVRVSRWQQNQDVKNKLPKVTDRTELDEYAYQCAYDMSNDWAIENPTWHDVEDACKLGAKWQKQQDQSTIELAEDHAMLAGMEKMKEQMVGKAIDVEVKVDAGGYPYITQIELYDYDKDIPLAKKGDKYKVVLIKE